MSVRKTNCKDTYTFTVFTPTYNRKHVLHRVYNSLKQQTYTDFEWIIVDDGSQDGTNEIVQLWKKESKFQIRYFYQTNQGKHMAFNRGVKVSRGELFLLIDSDDAFVPNTLERFKFHWDSISEECKDKYCGVTALCMDEKGFQIGDRFPKDVFDSDALELRYKYKIKGEKWGFIKTSVLKEFPFPSIKGTHYVSESIVWNAIANKFKTRYINDVLRIYFVSDQNTNQVTKMGPAKDAPSNVPYLESLFNNDIKWIIYSPKEFITYSVLYSRYCFHLKKGILDQMRSLHKISGRILWLFSLPLGIYLYKRDVRRTSMQCM